MLTDIHPNFSADKARGFLEGTDVKEAALIAHLSKGMLAQLHLAVVMAIDARLLVLDEPTLGLDITYRKRFYRRLLEDYMTADRTLLITTHQVDEIEFMLSDIMFIRDGALILHTPMEEVARRYAQVVTTADKAATAAALHPIFSETRFGQTVMVFDGADRAALEPLGVVSTPTLSDLFVALMSREPGVAS
jgi:ABC-2 type transport system ATP-binding protein